MFNNVLVTLFYISHIIYIYIIMYKNSFTMLITNAIEFNRVL